MLTTSIENNKEFAQPQIDGASVFNPEQVVENAASIATSLANIINKQKLFTIIQGKKYVHATGWGVLMAMNRVCPCVIKCERLDREDDIAYEAEVELLSYDGRIVGRGSAICSAKEPTKKGQPEYSIKSMAQTRATSKAARLSFAWIMSLAGYEATPAEEMTDLKTNNNHELNYSEIATKVKRCDCLTELVALFNRYNKDPVIKSLFVTRKDEIQKDKGLQMPAFPGLAKQGDTKCIDT